MSDMTAITSGFQDAGNISLICNGIGVLGFMLYMTSYTLVTFQKIDSRGVLFFCLNTGAACGVLISLTQSFNLASALIQVVWICLGSVAITTRLVNRRVNQREPGALGCKLG